MVKRNRLDMVEGRVAFTYHHCETCRRDFDKDNDEIIIDGTKFIKKKDANEVPREDDL